MELRQVESRMNSENNSGAGGFAFHAGSGAAAEPDIMPGPGEDPVPF